MSILTHKAASENSVVDRGVLSPVNSAGAGCPIYYPFDEQDPINITGATQANPCVITANNTYTNGQRITISGMAENEMDELNGGWYTVANATGTTFELSGVNSTAFTAYVSGGVCNLLPVSADYASGNFSMELSHMGPLRKAFTKSIVGGTAAPTAGDVGTTITADDSVLIYTMCDFATAVESSAAYCAMLFGTSGGGFGWDSTQNLLFSYVSGYNSIVVSGAEVAALLDGYDSVIIGVSLSRVSDGGNIELFALNGTETSFDDRIILATMSSFIAVQGTMNVANRIKMHGAAFGAFIIDTDTYFFGVQKFANGLPATLFDDLMRMRSRALEGQKGLPASWVAEG